MVLGLKDSAVEAELRAGAAEESTRRAGCRLRAAEMAERDRLGFLRRMGLQGRRLEGVADLLGLGRDLEEVGVRVRERRGTIN